MMTLPRISFRQLEYFVAVAEALHFRRAAARLGVSQPTLTNQIAALEEGLGVQLFERSHTGSTVTPAGRELLGRARRVLEEFRGLLDHARSSSSGPIGTYRIGTTPTLGPYLLPHILPDLHERYAGLKLYVREHAPRRLEQGLSSGDHDLILTPMPVDAVDGLTVAPLFRERVALVMSADHPLAKRDVVGLGDLAGEHVLTLEEHHLFHRQIEQLCKRLGARVRRDYEGTSLDTLRHMVVMGMGIAFLPSLYVLSEIHRPEKLRVTSLDGEVIERSHALAWRTASPNAELFGKLAADIRQIVESELADHIIPID